MKYLPFLLVLAALGTTDAQALEKNHSHRWNSNDDHKRYRPLKVPADEAQKTYDESVKNLEKSIEEGDKAGTRTNAAKALSALETVTRSSDDKGFVKDQRANENALDSIRHSARKGDMKRAKKLYQENLASPPVETEQ